MLQALVITLREGVEAALIIGITLVYLSKIGRNDLRRVVYSALAAALVASVGAAVLLARLEINQEAFEGWVMLGAAALTISMIVFMQRAARKLRGEIEGRVGGFADRGSILGLFAFVFLMVLREGVETVLVLAAVSLNSDELTSFLGTLVGIALAVAFGVMFVKGSVRVDLQKFFRITTVILYFVAAQLIISGLHELSEAGIVPASKRSMALIGPVVRNDVFFFVTILLLAGLMILFEWRRRAPLAAAGSQAEQRKALWTLRRERFWMGAVYASSFLFIVLVTAQFIYAKSTATLSPATEITLENGAARVPLSEVSDGNLHRYTTVVEGTPVRFLLFQKPDGKVVAVFDACEICGSVGFYQTAEGIVCMNCAAPINPIAVGQGGGCNPVPLKAEVANGSVVISQAELAGGLRHFQQ
jgi:high-affinity iron transporter